VRSVHVAILALAATGTSCAPSSIEGGFDSANPAARIYAMKEAIRTGDDSPETLHHIVEQLDSDDPAVRLMAIGALEKLTGRTRGYRYDDPRPDRNDAIRRWVEALETGDVEGNETTALAGTTWGLADG
jgi:hypothetical protein